MPGKHHFYTRATTADCLFHEIRCSCTKQILGAYAGFAVDPALVLATMNEHLKEIHWKAAA